MADKVGSIYYDLDLDDKGFKSKLGNASNDVKGFGGVLGNVGGVVKKMSGFLVAAGAATAGIGGFALSSASEMEMLRSSLDVMTGSAETGGKMFKDLYDFAAKTPFETGQLADAAKTMLGFGVPAKDVQKNLQMIGDVSMGNGDKLQSLTLAFSQIKSTGKLMGQDLLQLINAGFNPLSVISEKTGKSMSVLKDEMSKGQISADMVTDAFEIATSKGGLFYKGMDKGSETLSGTFSTLKDTAGTLARGMVGLSETGEVVKGGLMDKIKKGVGELTTQIQENTPSIVNKITEISGIFDNLGIYIDKVKEIIKGIVEVYNVFLKPAFDSLWKSISEKLLPALQDLWEVLEPLLIPLLKFLGFVVLGAVILAINILVYAIKGLVDWFSTVIEKVKFFFWVIGNIGRVVYDAMSGVYNALVEPFRSAFEWIKSAVDNVVNKLKDLSPFTRHSPSLVDQVTKGIETIKNQYLSLGDVSIPSVTSPEMMSGANSSSGTNQNVTFYIDKVRDFQDVQSIGRQLGFVAGLQPL